MSEVGVSCRHGRLREESGTLLYSKPPKADHENVQMELWDRCLTSSNIKRMMTLDRDGVKHDSVGLRNPTRLDPNLGTMYRSCRAYSSTGD